MELGSKLKNAMTIIKWATYLELDDIMLPFNAELENQLFLLGFKCKTLKYKNGEYLTKVS